VPDPDGRRSAAAGPGLRRPSERLWETAAVTPPVIAVVGPTAAGKSDLAVELALALDGEIVNADAMQLYRGMDIGTAKLTAEQRRGVRHHLLDVLDVREDASVAAYQRQARQAIAGITARGRRAILVGGSLDTLDIPPTDAAVRGRWEAELAASGAPALHARLASLDPAAAAHILPGNGRRIVRALEVMELTGRPFSASMPQQEYAAPAVQLGISVPRPELDERIAVRVDRMWADGLVEEVRSLQGRGLREGRTASRALGYAQVLRLLAGECDEPTARQDTVRATRRFARRQESWFRRDPRVQWLSHGDPELAGSAKALIDPV
jgi:tRNA dimethylallyltransferase